MPSFEPAKVPDGNGEAMPEVVDAAQVAENLKALQALGYLGSRSSAEPEAPGVVANESSPEVRNNLGRVHLAKGELDQARAEFQAALALDPGNADALLSLAALLRAEGKTTAAEQMAQRAPPTL